MQGGWTRRAFLARSGAAAGVAALVAAGCSSDDDDDTKSRGKDKDEGSGNKPRMSPDGVVNLADVPTKATIFGWVNEVFDHGIRRPGYDADVWVEGFIKDEFEGLGLEKVRLEPIKVKRWEPKEWKLEVLVAGKPAKEIDAFPVPYAVPVDGLEVDLAAFDKGNPGAVKDKAALYDVTTLEVPADLFVPAADREARIVDPDGTLSENHLLPFGGELDKVTEPSVEAGAKAFIGTLANYPTDTCDYFVPYTGKTVDIPGVWINHSDGQWLHDQLKAGPVKIRLSVDATNEEFESHNVVGELPGADDDVVMVASHHDGPWSSAVEDGSGISMVLAQATYWSKQPKAKRPHRMVFLLQGGHMSGGAGLLQYIEKHRAELKDVVLELHMEHAAREFGKDEGDGPQPTGRPVPRWWFTSELPPLKKAVFEALKTEDLRRSMILPPDAIGSQPPTDGAFYYNQGVPIVHFLSAPWYLFDKQDTLDKIDQDSLEPLTRAAIRILDSTKGVSAVQMRAS
jgi:hypothetical protein